MVCSGPTRRPRVGCPAPWSAPGNHPHPHLPTCIHPASQPCTMRTQPASHRQPRGRGARRLTPSVQEALRRMPGQAPASMPKTLMPGSAARLGFKSGWFTSTPLSMMHTVTPCTTAHAGRGGWLLLSDVTGGTCHNGGAARCSISRCTRLKTASCPRPPRPCPAVLRRARPSAHLGPHRDVPSLGRPQRLQVLLLASFIIGVIGAAGQGHFIIWLHGCHIYESGAGCGGWWA